jgi:hypothetical protein
MYDELQVESAVGNTAWQSGDCRAAPNAQDSVQCVSTGFPQAVFSHTIDVGGLLPLLSGMKSGWGKKGWVWWGMLIIPVTQETEIRRTAIQSQPEQKS